MGRGRGSLVTGRRDGDKEGTGRGGCALVVMEYELQDKWVAMEHKLTVGKN